MNLETQIKVLKGILTLLILCLFFFIGVGVGQGTITLSGLIKQAENHECQNKTFSEAIRCLNTDFNSWYKYNISNLGKKLSEADLKASGGVCSHASEWYGDQAKSLGYKATQIILLGKNVSKYCIVDQYNVIGCATLSGDGGGHQLVALYQDG